MMRAVMMTELQVNEEVSQDMTGDADGMNLRVDCRGRVMHIDLNWRSRVMQCNVKKNRLG